MNITLHEKRDFAAVIKDTEMGKLSWIIQVDLRYNHKYPYKRKEEGDLTTEVGHVMMEARGWSDARKGSQAKE